MSSPLAFISYRRADSSAASRWLANSIARTFGAESVFVDTESIRMSEKWAQRIELALDRSTVLIPVIGAHWLSITGAHHKRRIDDPNDWVHKEIAYAIAKEKRILPVLLSRTPMPSADALPTLLAPLCDNQAYELRDERWESDLDGLLKELQRFSFQRAPGIAIRYPSPMIALRELTTEEMRDSLVSLPGWQLQTSVATRARAGTRVELVKTFEFASFRDAICFMNEAVARINELQHHPRWENLWRSVTVCLSTWDIGERPSELDITLAKFLDAHRANYAAPKRPATEA